MRREVWRELADGVHVRSHHAQLLNVGLVIGSERCLVIDTRSTLVQGRELVDAVRRVTALPWVVVNTHAHWDHGFGNACFVPADIWAHERCRSRFATYGETQRDVVAARAAEAGETAFAAEMAAVELVLPDRTFDTTQQLDLGGRLVELRHLGRGHTDNDVTVEVPDADVVFAGDLLEEGDPPEFGDAFPLDWPATLERLRARVTGAVVPGHGEVVDEGFITAQAATIAAAGGIAREAHADARAADDMAVVARVTTEVGFPERTARQLLVRAHRQLDGAPAYDPVEQLRAEAGLSPRAARRPRHAPAPGPDPR
jgi:glyoxylase-like metal-dependent hydrolase (beta-lactamase superfamily II)